MTKTFIGSLKNLCMAGKDKWTTHTLTLTDEQIRKVKPIEDRAVEHLAIGETYINHDASRIVVRIS